MSQIKITIQELTDLVSDILVTHNTSLSNAKQVAEALVKAEIDGQKGHGLSRVASYAAQAKSGKVKGHIEPELEQVAPSLIRVDAKQGFAYPAFKKAMDHLIELTPKTGIAAAAIANSHHCGVAGHHAERLAENGLISLVFTNSPQAIAPWGGKDALFGTNPIAFAAPRLGKSPLVIDLSLSKVARGKIKVAAEKGEPIPEGWALDKDGKSTTDSKAAMTGTMLPMGEAKGAALVLMVEILTAALTASHFGFEASSFFEAKGESPNIGQTIIAISPGPLSVSKFSERIEVLIDAIIGQDGTRLPGSGKAEMRKKALKSGIEVTQKVYDDLVRLKR